MFKTLKNKTRRTLKANQSGEKKLAIMNKYFSLFQPNQMKPESRFSRKIL